MGTTETLLNKKILNLKELQHYTGLGRDASRRLAYESGAVFKVGRRVLINRDTLDRYVDEKTC